jgi:hypothetical protein
MRYLTLKFEESSKLKNETELSIFRQWEGEAGIEVLLGSGFGLLCPNYFFQQ